MWASGCKHWEKEAQASVSLKWDSWGLSPDLFCLNMSCPDHIYKYFYGVYIHTLYVLRDWSSISATNHLAALSLFFLAKKKQPSCQGTEVSTLQDQYLILKLIANKNKTYPLPDVHLNTLNSPVFQEIEFSARRIVTLSPVLRRCLPRICTGWGWEAAACCHVLS